MTAVCGVMCVERHPRAADVYHISTVCELIWPSPYNVVDDHGALAGGGAARHRAAKRVERVGVFAEQEDGVRRRPARLVAARGRRGHAGPLGALEHDQRKQQVNDAKMRAIKQHVEYDDFEKLVQGAHLRPIKPRSETLGNVCKPFDGFVMPKYEGDKDGAAPSVPPAAALAHVHWRDVEASVVYERVSPRGVASAWWTSGEPVLG